MQIRWLALLCCTFFVSGNGCTHPSANKAAGARQTANEDSRSASSEFEILQTGYRGEEDFPAESRFSLVVQIVELEDQPQAAAVLDELWETETARNRTMPASEIAATVQSLVNQGLARLTVHPAISLPDSRQEHWEDGRGASWVITAARAENKSIHLSLIGTSLHQSPEAPPDSGWRTEAAAELPLEQSLVVEGPTLHTSVTEVSRSPLVGNLPIIGGFWNSKRTTLEAKRTLYILTVVPAGGELEP